MLHAWRKHGHGEIIGVQHATVPFWHLYYFDDPRSWSAAQRCPMPLPDRLMVNGALPYRTFASAGFPADRLVKVEALRYLNLAGVAVRPGENDDSGLPKMRILILGDMIAAAMQDFLRLVELAVPSLPVIYEFAFKPHPGLAVRLADYPGLHAEETTEALDRILGQFDLALSANSTSAAVDAYAVGLPVIIMLDGAALNLSPLRGQPGVCFVSGAHDLVEAIMAVGHRRAAEPNGHELFVLNPQLPGWRALLSRAQSVSP